MTEQSGPKEATVRKLFAFSMNRCAFPDCETPIIDSKTNTVVGEICHIRAQKENGPRFDPKQTPEERHSLENLILLCSVHHKIIDNADNLREYTSEYLLGLKRRHEENARKSGITVQTLTNEFVRALQDTSNRYESNSVYMDFRHATFRAGGEGGGYGGGGGDGGVITIVGTTRPPPDASIDLAARPATGYGGGGGGGGAL